MHPGLPDTPHPSRTGFPSIPSLTLGSLQMQASSWSAGMGLRGSLGWLSGLLCWKEQGWLCAGWRELLQAGKGLVQNHP